MTTGACKTSRPGSEDLGTRVLALERLGISAVVPRDARVTSQNGGGVVISGANLHIHMEDGTSKPADPDRARPSAGSVQNLKVDLLKDGFIMTYMGNGMAGTHHVLKGRRMIQGKAYWCSAVASSATIIGNAVKVCKSLRQ